MLGGNGEVRSRISNEEIIERYLRPKVDGELTTMPGFIVELEEDLYTREPWLLPHVTHPTLNPREWFYFGKRNRKYLMAEGVHFEGSWVPIQGRCPIRSNETGEAIGGTMRFRYAFRKKEDKDSDMLWSNWFMREYRLFDNVKGTLHQRQVLCKITCNDKNFID